MVNMDDTTPIFTWETPEYEYREKTPDWYWGLGLLSITGIVLSIIWKNMLLAILLTIGTFLLVLYSRKDPETLSVAIHKKGVQVNKNLYPYTELHGYWVYQKKQDGPWRLMVHTKGVLHPFLVIPIDTNAVNPQDLYRELEKYLSAEEYHEPFSHQITEIINF
jgi:hypothetical protein